MVTESHVHLMMDFDHAIADGTMARRVFQQIFEALQGRELQKNYYYLFLRRYAQRMRTPEARTDYELVWKLYDGRWSGFPKPDYSSRDNSNLSLNSATNRSFGEYRAAADACGVSMGTALVTAGLMALSRYNGQQKVSVEWVYNGRDEEWKEKLIGLTLCGVPAVMDFGVCRDRESILAEARRQNELGLQYAEYSFALQNMSPGRSENMKIVYEHGLDLPENMPAGTTLQWDSDSYTGMLCLFQFIINEGAANEPLAVMAVCQGSRYREESVRRMLSLFTGALDELLFPETARQQKPSGANE